jgi:hypothetical protein
MKTRGFLFQAAACRMPPALLEASHEIPAVNDANGIV